MRWHYRAIDSVYDLRGRSATGTCQDFFHNLAERGSWVCGTGSGPEAFRTPGGKAGRRRAFRRRRPTWPTTTRLGVPPQLVSTHADGQHRLRVVGFDTNRVGDSVLARQGLEGRGIMAWFEHQCR